MRICLVYDCLYPYTIGGAERWYRSLAERLATEGHEVTYLTLRQWSTNERGEVRGVCVVPVGPRMALYGSSGQRRILPPLLFGLGVLLHLLRHGRRYHVVHTASFPYFSLLAAALLRPLGRYALVVDWHEFWSRNYWRRYLGGLGGRIGWFVQSLCLRVPQEAFCFARLTAARLRAHGLSGQVTVLEGEYAGPLNERAPQPADPLVLFAGRHIPEKRPTAVVKAVALARERIPELTAAILGDGPERAAVLATIAERGLGEVIAAPGFVAGEVVRDSMSRALCLLLPTAREGYGLVVVEASAAGTPSILVRGEDNAATELVEEGVNGFVAADASAEELAEAIVRVQAAGHALRVSTAAWFARNKLRLSLGSSLDRITAIYRQFGYGRNTGSTPT
jgi:glycosyltransferase involved in cell wall biosynthesis